MEYREYTKENPSCFCSMLQYLAELDKTETTKSVELKEMPKSRRKGGLHYIKLICIKDGVEYINPSKKQIKGGLWVYECEGGIQIPTDVKFDSITAIVEKTLSDYKTQPKSAGSYNDSLGGGWYSKCSLYKVNDRYFANMDCACR